jgi:hypothetical protein
MAAEAAVCAGNGTGKCRYRQYEMELAAGRFDAHENDLTQDEMITYVAPLDSTELLGLALPLTNAERLERKLMDICPGGQMDPLLKKVKEKAHREYDLDVMPEFEGLRSNSDQMKKSITDPDDPILRRPVVIPLQTSNPERLKKEIHRLEVQLAALRSKNSDLEKHISVLLKCRETLIFEESAAHNLLSFRSDTSEYDRRLAKARSHYQSAMKKLEGKVVPR